MRKTILSCCNIWSDNSEVRINAMRITSVFLQYIYRAYAQNWVAYQLHDMRIKYNCECEGQLGFTHFGAPGTITLQ